MLAVVEAPGLHPIQVNQEPLRVAHVISALNRGGAERLLVEMVKHVSLEGLPAEFCVLSLADGPMRAELEAQGCPVFVSEGKSRVNLALPRWLLKNFREHSIDIVHAHLPRAGFYARLAAKAAGIPLVYTEHNVWDMYDPKTRLLNRCTYRLNTSVVAVSHAVLNSTSNRARHSRRAMTVIHNGVDVPHRQVRTSHDGGSIVVVTVANLHHRKGHEHLLHAHAALLRRGADVQLVLIGRDDGTGEALRALAAKLRIHDRVTFLGERQDVSALLGEGDIFVLPSLFEGLPVACIEAMAVGLPVVATAVGGVPELVVPGKTGLLVPPASADALATALQDLLDDPGLRRSMGDAGRRRVEESFSLAHMVRSYFTVYSQAAMRRRTTTVETGG